MSGGRCPACGGIVAPSGPLAGLCPTCLLSTVADALDPAPDPVGQGFSPAFPGNIRRETGGSSHPDPDADKDSWHTVALIGESAWGRSFLGRRRSGPAPVVIRVMHARRVPACDAEAIVATQRWLASAVIHPLLAGVRAAGLTADGRPFVVRDYVAGRPLDEFRRNRAPDAGLVTAVLARAREALEMLHGRGVAHGHLVAANVLVAGSGRAATVTLTDAALHAPGRHSASAIDADLLDLAALAGDPRAVS